MSVVYVVHASSMWHIDDHVDNCAKYNLNFNNRRKNSKIDDTYRHSQRPICLSKATCMVFSLRPDAMNSVKPNRCALWDL